MSATLGVLLHVLSVLYYHALLLHTRKGAKVGLNLAEILERLHARFVHYCSNFDILGRKQSQLLLL